MNRVACFLAVIAALSGCATQSPQSAPVVRRPAFVDSVTPLPDGTKEIVVSGQFKLAASGNQVQSINLRERLEEAAKAECAGSPYELTPGENIGNQSGKSNGLKFTMKGVVRCTR